MNPGTWINGAQKVTGWWNYNWGADKFTIILDRKDRLTGSPRQFIVYGDTPEWGNWKLQRGTRLCEELAMMKGKHGNI